MFFKIQKFSCNPIKILGNLCLSRDPCKVSISFFSGRVSFGGKNKRSSNNNTSWNSSVAFCESCLSISEVNYCLTYVNKRNLTSSEVR